VCNQQAKQAVQHAYDMGSTLDLRFIGATQRPQRRGLGRAGSAFFQQAGATYQRSAGKAGLAARSGDGFVSGFAFGRGSTKAA
jgi:hypothetical protein